MHYLIYKTTNSINGKFYIGKHQTNDLEDGYLGSGKLLKRAIKKYGIENFKREILQFCSSEQEMNEAEKNHVVLCEDSYNLRVGGEGGWGYVNSEKDYFNKKRIQTWYSKSKEERDIINRKKSLPGELNPMYGTHRNGNDSPTYGWVPSQETRMKISKANKGKKASKETKQKLSNAQTEIWKDKNRRKERSEEWKRKGIKPPSSKGLLWWNDGISCVRSKVSPGESFIRGRLSFVRGYNK